jgi:Carboxypeptidase regulatory-like domain
VRGVLRKSLGISFVGSLLLTFSVWAGASALEGIVRDPAGRPVKGADVRIETKNFSKVVKSDANGHYTCDGLAAGTYKVTLIVNGSVKASILNAKTQLGKRTQLNFELTARTASVKTHKVWVAPDTGTHIGSGQWIDVDENGNPVNLSGTSGINTVETVNRSAIQNLRPSAGKMPGGRGP